MKMVNQYKSSINRKIISFRYYAVSHKISKLYDLFNSFIPHNCGPSYDCIEIPKAEALQKLTGLVFNNNVSMQNPIYFSKNLKKTLNYFQNINLVICLNCIGFHISLMTILMLMYWQASNHNLREVRRRNSLLLKMLFHMEVYNRLGLMEKKQC